MFHDNFIQWQNRGVVYAQYYNYDGEKLANTTIEYKIRNKIYTARTDDAGVAVLKVNLKSGKYTLQLINPVNNKETNVILTINGNNNVDKQVRSYKTHVKQIKNNNQYIKQKVMPKYKIIHGGQVILEGKYITLEAVNKIFGQQFINGHLCVYIDGQLIFNSTVQDDISTIIAQIIDKYIGNHQIKVIFTDNTNQTHEYQENITIR